MFVQPKRSTHATQPVPIHFGADFSTERAACIHHADGFQPAAGILGDFPRRTYARGGVAVVQGVSFFINAVAARGQLGIIASHERDVVRQVGQITVQMIVDFFAFPIGRHAPFLEFIAFRASPLSGFIGRLFAAVYRRSGCRRRCRIRCRRWSRYGTWRRCRIRRRRWSRYGIWRRCRIRCRHWSRRRTWGGCRRLCGSVFPSSDFRIVVVIGR